MSSYLTLAAGAIFLTVVVGLIIPEGKLNKFINFAMRLICIFVLIQPITQIFQLTDASEVLIDYDYICDVYSKSQSKMLEEQIFSDLQIECECYVAIDYVDEQIIQSEVSVVIANEFYDEQTKNEIYAYLLKLGYIDINVNEKDL
jgi:hypothetical protein